jgi:hypothetical protein
LIKRVPAGEEALWRTADLDEHYAANLAQHRAIIEAFGTQSPDVRRLVEGHIFESGRLLERADALRGREVLRESGRALARACLKRFNKRLETINLSVFRRHPACSTVATSGVTGHLRDRNMHDSGLRIAVFMRFLGSGGRRTRMVERSDFGRLLPDCCPEPAAQSRISTSGRRSRIRRSCSTKAAAASSAT